MSLEFKLHMTFGSQCFLQVNALRSKCLSLKKIVDFLQWNLLFSGVNTLLWGQMWIFLKVSTFRGKYCSLEKIVDFLLLWLLEVNAWALCQLLLLEANVFLWEILWIFCNILFSGVNIFLWGKSRIFGKDQMLFSEEVVFSIEGNCGFSVI